MGNVYSVHIASGNAESGSIVLLAAIPAAYVYVVRDIDVTFFGTAAQAQTSSISFIDDTDTPIFSLASGAISPGAWYGWRGRQVFAPGDTLTAIVVNPLFTFRVSGYQLTTP